MKSNQRNINAPMILLGVLIAANALKSEQPGKHAAAISIRGVRKNYAAEEGVRGINLELGEYSDLSGRTAQARPRYFRDSEGVMEATEGEALTHPLL